MNNKEEEILLDNKSSEDNTTHLNGNNIFFKRAELNKIQLETNDENSSISSKNDKFSCGICFDSPTDPVVTQCGHLFCWNCLKEVCSYFLRFLDIKFTNFI